MPLSFGILSVYNTVNGVIVFVVSVTPPCSAGVPTENDGANDPQ